MNPSTLTPVRSFRQILLLPLYLEPTRGTTSLHPPLPHRPEALLGEAGQPWKRLENTFADADLLALHSNPALQQQGKQRAYAEFVYFHPFVQSLLYPKPDDPFPPIQIYFRNDVARLHLGGLRNPGPGESLEQVGLQVHRIWLVIAQPDIAVLCLEVGTHRDQALRVDDCQRIIDQLRRIYPPYWENGKPGHCPGEVRLLGHSDETLACSNHEDIARHTHHAATHRTAPVAAHWQFLLRPFLTESPGGDASPRAWSINHCVDDRAPFMAYVAMDDPKRLSRGDFIRLAFGDDPPWHTLPGGRARTLPYTRSFLARFEQEYCYDRYWGGSSDQPWHNTRHMCCGYGFVSVGQADGFFTDGDSGGLAHFRHHYFKMALLAHLQKASLLALSHRLSTLIATYPGHAEGDALGGQFAARLERHHRFFLNFSHRYWFHEVSNQVQGRELFALWQKHLGTQGLYEETRQELSDAMASIAAKRSEQLGRQSADLARNANTLAYIGMVGVAASIAIGLAAISGGNDNIWFIEDAAKRISLVVVLGLIFVVVLFLLEAFRSLTADKASRASPSSDTHTPE